MVKFDRKTRYTISQIEFQLWFLTWHHLDETDPMFYKWKRHYLLRRLLALQLEGFNREEA